MLLKFIAMRDLTTCKPERKAEIEGSPSWSKEDAAEEEDGSLNDGVYSLLGFSTSRSTEMSGPAPCSPAIAVLRPLHMQAMRD